MKNLKPFGWLVVLGAVYASVAFAGENKTLEERVADLERRVAALEGKPPAAVPAPTGVRKATSQQKAALIAVSNQMRLILTGRSKENIPTNAVSPEHRVAFEEFAADVDTGLYGFAWPRQDGAKVPGIESACTMISLDVQLMWLKGHLKQETQMKKVFALSSAFTGALEIADPKAAYEAWQAWRKAFPEGWYK